MASKSEVQLRSNIGHSFYNNYNPNHYANVQPHRPTYYSNNYYALQRRPYAATGAQRSHNMVDYHNRVGYMNTVQTPYEQRQQPKVHSIVYANQIGNYGLNRRQVPTNYWAEWSTWSKCSKPCNGGVRTRIRVCKSNQPNSHSQNADVLKTCVGYRRGYKACNTQLCMSKDQMKKKKHKDRGELCSRQNNVQYHGIYYKWVPYMRDGLSECKLNCLAEGHKMFKSFGNVKDGTMCGHNDGYVCQKGLCKKKQDKNKVVSKPTARSSNGISSDGASRNGASRIGASRNGILNSPTNPRRSNSLQKERWINVKNNFLKTNGMAIGYNHVLRLPRGAVNITIKDLAPSYNYFALKIRKLFILNGKWQIKSNKLFYAASSTFRYIVSKGSEGKTLEKIFSPGPLGEAVDVMVHYQRSSINITYGYSLRKNEPKNTLLGINPSSQQSISRGISHYPPQQLRYQQARLNSAPNYRYNTRQGNVPRNIRQNSMPYNSNLNNRVYNSRQNNAPYNSIQNSNRYNSVHNNGGYNSPLSQAKRYRVVHPHLPLSRQKVPSQKVVYRWQIGGITKCSAKCNGDADIYYEEDKVKKTQHFRRVQS